MKWGGQRCELKGARRGPRDSSPSTFPGPVWERGEKEEGQEAEKEGEEVEEEAEGDDDDDGERKKGVRN